MANQIIIKLGLNKIYQKLNLSFEEWGFIKLNLIFLVLNCVINFTFLFFYVCFIEQNNDLYKISFTSLNTWINFFQVITQISIFFFSITSLVNLFQIKYSLLVFSFPIFHFLVNHLIFFVNLKEWGGDIKFFITNTSWAYEWLYNSYFEFQLFTSHFFPLSGHFDHQFFIPDPTTRFYLLDILLPNIYLFALASLTYKIYNSYKKSL